MIAIVRENFCQQVALCFIFLTHIFPAQERERGRFPELSYGILLTGRNPPAAPVLLSLYPGNTNSPDNT